jgi:hypothetical protein
MPKLEGNEEIIEFEVYCARCGAGICGNVDVSHGRAGHRILRIDPCERCLKSERDEGYDEGYQEGQTEAEEDT